MDNGADFDFRPSLNLFVAGSLFSAASSWAMSSSTAAAFCRARFLPFEEGLVVLSVLSSGFITPVLLRAAALRVFDLAFPVPERLLGLSSA
jgi:hypothetical protein